MNNLTSFLGARSVMTMMMLMMKLAYNSRWCTHDRVYLDVVGPAAAEHNIRSCVPCKAGRQHREHAVYSLVQRVV